MRPSPLFKTIEPADAYTTDRASYKGIAIKSIILLLLVVASAVASGILVYSVVNPEGGLINVDNIPRSALTTFLIFLVIALILSFVSAIVGRMSYRLAKPFSIIYALSEGMLVGTLTAAFECVVPGIAIVAIGGTGIIFAIMLVLFFTGVIKVNNKFRAIALGIGLGAIALSLFSLIFILITGAVNNALFDTPTYLGIMIAVEAFFLLYGVITLTFNFAEAQMLVQNGVDKRAEWSVALGLNISLVYIYLELLRLLYYISRFASKN